MQLKDYDTTQKFSAVVKQSRRITPDDSEEVRELVLEIQNPDFHFSIGQSIGVLVPGPHETGHKNHFRVYTIADASKDAKQTQVELCVKRITYIDEYSGEAYPGIASNYLCNLKQGESLKITGPYDLPFQIPADKKSNIIMIGLGTGIAPFRAFVRHIYDTIGNWQGQVRLFYGARTGLESLYMNDQQNDFSQYYDEKTFKAFTAVSPRAHWGEPAALDKSLIDQEQEIWDLLQQTNTYLFIAGHEEIEIALEKAFSHMAGSTTAWQKHKQHLIKTKHWCELLY